MAEVSSNKNLALHHFTKVDFTRFKAFRRFALKLRPFNVLVGPNNAGKSTILAAFRILAVAMRKARSRRPEVVDGPDGPTGGYKVDIRAISVAEENIFYNYDSTRPAIVRFTLSNSNSLTLYFAADSGCVLIPSSKQSILSPTSFQKEFNCPIGFAPILGPVDHNERLFTVETAKDALLNYTASRNFRNIWFHFPEKFSLFRETLKRTWPGMDIDPPESDYSGEKALLHMFCPEERIPREIFWAGFGFQVWCQMLTHVIQSDDKAIFLIDEPDIYLHSDLQRQLLSLLRQLGPDIVLATHSTEIVSESEPEDIVIVDKRRERAQRIREASQIMDVFEALGSNLNPLLTQLAKTRRAVFVEGDDFQILSRFAQRLGSINVSNRSGFAVIPLKGFNPTKAKHLKEGIEATVGSPIAAAVLLDRDYRSAPERQSIIKECLTFCDLAIVHNRKEIENFLLIPAAIDRAAARRVHDRAKRTGEVHEYTANAHAILEAFAEEKRSHTLAQHVASREIFERIAHPRMHKSDAAEAAINEFESAWQNFDSRMAVLPGKEALSHVSQMLQSRVSISVTAGAIIDGMITSEIPDEIRELICKLEGFCPHTSSQ